MNARSTPLLTAFGFRSIKTETQPQEGAESSQRFVMCVAYLIPVAVCLYLANIEPLSTVGTVEFTHPDVVVVALGLFVFLHSLWKGFYWLPKQLFLSLALYFAATFLSALLAQNKLRGVAALLQIIEFAVLMWSVSFLTSSKRCLSVIHFLLAVFVFESLVATFQFVIGDPLPRGTFMVHQTYSMFMGAGAALCFGMFSGLRSKGAKWGYFATMLILLFGAVLGQERAPWLAFVIAALAVIYLSGKQRKKLLLGFVCAVIVAVSLVISIPQLRERTVSRLAEAQTDSDQQNSLLVRLAVWGVALHLFAEHPVLGVGPKNFVDYVPSFLTTREMMGLEAADSHNIWLGILAEGGVLGFLTYVYLCYAIAALAIQKLRDPHYQQSLRPILLGYLGYHFFCFAMSYHYFTKAQGHLHFLMIGLLLGVERGVDLRTNITRLSAYSGMKSLQQ